jgi:hypothetical protein
MSPELRGCAKATIVLRIIAVAVILAFAAWTLYPLILGGFPEDPWIWVQYGGLAIAGLGVVMFVLSGRESEPRRLPRALIYAGLLVSVAAAIFLVYLR